MRSAVHSLYKKTAETLLPPLSKSAFEEKRVLTPQEFVASGDYLVRACPTWSWEGGDPQKARSYLPADKQYLVTRNVPCLSRASDLERYDPKSEFALEGDEDGWTATHKDPAADSRTAKDEDAELPSIDEAGTSTARGAAAAGSDDDVPDISDLELQDEATVSAGDMPRATDAAHDGIVRTRTYDLYITYDHYYQVPRLWLAGYDESRTPLHPDAILEDVSAEHAKKTITVDPHPHLSLTAASIHPCRHAEVMKKLADNLVESGREFRVDQYMVLFLKFIASVVPTIQYDYTMSVGGD